MALLSLNGVTIGTALGKSVLLQFFGLFMHGSEMAVPESQLSPLYPASQAHSPTVMLHTPLMHGTVQSMRNHDYQSGLEENQ